MVGCQATARDACKTAPRCTFPVTLLFHKVSLSKRIEVWYHLARLDCKVYLRCPHRPYSRWSQLYATDNCRRSTMIPPPGSRGTLEHTVFASSKTLDYISGLLHTYIIIVGSSVAFASSIPFPGVLRASIPAFSHEQLAREMSSWH